jgi:uncharacterized membrane protein
VAKESHAPITDPAIANRPASASVELGWLAVLCLVGLAARAVVYLRMENVLHADSAVHGLLARHLLGGEFELFTYGLPYAGTLQDYWIALCFALFGQSTFVLKWAAGIRSLGLIAATYLLGREMGGGDRRVGRLAALLTALGPLYLLEWSLRPRGGHVEVMAFSALVLWMVLRAGRLANAAAADSTPLLLTPARRWLVLAAFVLGVSWWLLPIAVYALGTCFLIFLWKGAGLRRDTRTWLYAVGAFVVGSFPFWLYNIEYRGASLKMFLVRGTEGEVLGGTAHRIWEALTVAVPVLLGARQTEALQSFGVLACAAAVLGYGALVAAAAVLRWRNREQRAAVGAGLLFLAVAFAVYVATAFGAYPREPRYLLPAYAVLGPLVAAGAVGLWDRGGLRRWAGGVLVLVVLGVSLNGYWRGERDVMQPWGQEKYIPNDLARLIEFLDSHGITRVFTNFYIGYRLDFETKERILACTQGDPIRELYAPYRQAVRSASPPAAFIVGPQVARWLAEVLQERKISYQRESVEGFDVVFDLSAPFLDYPPGPQFCGPAGIAVGPCPKECGPGERFDVEIRARNRGLLAWPPPPHWRAVQFSYHLVDPETGKMVRFENPRFPLKQAVAPGESTTVTITIEAPKQPGRYAFVADLVMERHAWFSQFQSNLTSKRNRHDFVVTPSGSPVPREKTE